MDKKVIVSRLDEYNLDMALTAVRTHFCELNPEIKAGMTVVIKPNLVIKAKADSAIITHPIIVAAVGLAVKEMGAKVLIAESSGGIYSPSNVKSIFSACGYTEIADKYDFELYTDCEYETVHFENSEICSEFNICKPFVNADFIINIAKLKSHGMTVYSGAIKNLFGTIPGLMKPELHFRYPNTDDFATMLVDLCLGIKPNLSFIDATYIMEGDGPTGGTSRFLGLLLSSSNPFYLDATAAFLAGFSVDEIPMLKNAADRKLCPRNDEDTEFIGENPKNFIMHDFKRSKVKSLDFLRKLPKFLRPPLKKLMQTKTKIIKSKCIGCGKCAESCPVHTIDITNKKAKINYKKCIYCFCCHEMCPVKAVDFKKFSLFKF